MPLGPSELILNADGSIYHLNLFPSDIAQTIITVGDPDRVAAVSDYFDTVEVRKAKREFHTHTGVLNGRRITVISTGIGTDNIDIVLNELDALANIDFKSRTINRNHIRFNIVRIGTSGAIQPEIPVDSFLLSEFAMGFDGLLHFYDSVAIQEKQISDAFLKHVRWPAVKARPYVVKCDAELADRMASNHIRFSMTATNSGFYGPQGRQLRLKADDRSPIDNLASFDYSGLKISNLEMETSGIYGLSKLLGHRAVSLNAVLANRATGEFSRHPEKTVDKLIEYTLKKLAQ